MDATQNDLAASLDRLGACLPLAGTDRFLEPFLAALQAIGAAQCMVFSYGDGRVRCLLARNFVARPKGQTLAEAYLSGWYVKDPLFREILAMADGDCRVTSFADNAHHMDGDYRDLFFAQPGLHEKAAVLTVRGNERLILNIYSASDTPVLADAGEPGRAALALAGRLAADHFARQRRPDYPPPLSVLSKRERTVCSAILAGKKAETIAGDLRLAVSTVVTYRRRAYTKLGISSRGQLFAICGD